MPSDFEISELLLLCTISGIGSQRIRNLMSRFRSPEKIFKASLRQLVEVEGIDKLLAAKIKKGGDSNFARLQVSKAKQWNADITSYWDLNYPRLLKQASDPPLLIFSRGQIEHLHALCVAIVGTRVPSTYGKLMADLFARELSAKSIVVVSGLARGIDTIVHRAVVRSGGITVAVLGSGVDKIYPDENKKLADNIINTGIVISEFYMGAKPDAPHFPRRNRIISGLSAGTLVIEAGKRSGALITTDFALEQNRDVFALPGNINNPKSYGCNYLIQQGAKLVTSVDDVLEDVGQPFQMEQKRKLLLPEFSMDEKKVFETLGHEPKHIDMIAIECQLPVSRVLGILLSFELKNIVQQMSGKNFLRAV